MWVKKAIEVLEKIGVLDELRQCSHIIETDCPTYALALRFLNYAKLLKEKYGLTDEDIMRIAIAILWCKYAQKYRLNKILPYGVNELLEKLREVDDKEKINIKLNPSDRPELKYPKPPHIENKGPVILLVGPPGIGKSTYIEQRKGLTPNIFVVSRDEVIEEMKEELGIETYNKAFEVIHSNTELLNELNNRFTEKLKEARKYEGTVIVDMTNMVRKWRIKTLNDIDPKRERYRKAIIFLNSWQNILENNRSRIGKEIPEEVIVNMLRRFTMPEPAEGIHEINYHFSSQIF